MNKRTKKLRSGARTVNSNSIFISFLYHFLAQAFYIPILVKVENPSLVTPVTVKSAYVQAGVVIVHLQLGLNNHSQSGQNKTIYQSDCASPRFFYIQYLPPRVHSDCRLFRRYSRVSCLRVTPVGILQQGLDTSSSTTIHQASNSTYTKIIHTQNHVESR